MSRNRMVLLAAAIFLAGRCWGAMGMVSIKGTKEESEIKGHLKLEDTEKGLKLTGQMENIPSGNHGFHIHEFGDCDEEGKKAGGHFNPDRKPHGHALKDGAGKVHPGDMGNITADEKGFAAVNILVPRLSLTGGKYSVAGRAVIVHEWPDDFSQPTGNAGGRIACGPIVLTGQ